MTKIIGPVSILAHEEPLRASALFDAVRLARKHNAPAYVKPCARGWEASLDGSFPSWCPRDLIWVVGQFGAVAAL